MKKTPLEDWILHRTGIQTKSREALQEYQLQQLKKTLTYAKARSRYYKRKLAEIDIDSINSISGFETLPFTVPEDMKTKSSEFLCVSEKEIKRIVTLNTSGTSGEEKRIYFTEKDLALTIDFFQYGMRCLTDHGDRVLVLLPGKAYGSIGDLLKKALALSGIDCVVHGVLTDPGILEKDIIQNKITCIVGIPMQVYYFSKVKSAVFQNHIKKVLLSTDYVPEVLVKELKSRSNCAVFNHYGMTEMGYGGGVECEANQGYHLRECDLYFEIINPETGEVLKDGQYGEVVFTTFHRQAMPLIRYRTGDMARFLTDPCECGTFLRTMEKVIGRMTNHVVLKNAEEIHLRDLDEILLDFKEVLDYIAVISGEDTLSIHLILNHKNHFEKLKEEITKRIRARWKFPFKLKIDWKPDDRTPKITNSMIKRKIISV